MAKNHKIKLAKHKQTGEIIHIDKANKGLLCNCECEKCHNNLIAHQGKKEPWHFQHENNDISCNGSQETALHKLGKQILMGHNGINIPVHGMINYTDQIEEKVIENRLRVDVAATYENQDIYFEIKVSHSNEEAKNEYFAKGHHKCVEIDLIDAYKSSYENIEYLVLKKTTNKELIGWNSETIPDRHKDSRLNWFETIIYIASVMYVIYRIGTSIYNLICGNKKPMSKQQYMRNKAKQFRLFNVL